MNSDLISILLPICNAEKYLPACLTSILEQSEENWELLAVDDCSSDATWRILEQYRASDKRIRIFKNKEKGIVPALRLAFKESKGKYLTRMDADDLMAKNKLAYLKEPLVQKGIGHLTTACVKYFSEQALGQGYQKYADWLNDLCLKKEHYKAIYKECVIPSPCWMLDRADLVRCGAFESNRYPEDYDLCFRFYERKLRVVGVPAILHFWRDHPERTSRTSEVYADNRFLDLKLDYFLKLDYKAGQDLVLWGAGKKGKKIAQYLVDQQIRFRWVCDRESKWGHQIYQTLLEDYQILSQLDTPQVIIAVANQEAQRSIRSFLKINKLPKDNAFFFC
ncbi:MAG: glycosyltransferase family 2 protein [Bacteroidota bacterium]